MNRRKYTPYSETRKKKEKDTFTCGDSGMARMFYKEREGRSDIGRLKRGVKVKTVDG